MWQTKAEAMGYAYVASGPLVRSSYKAYVKRAAEAPPPPFPGRARAGSFSHGRVD